MRAWLFLALAGCSSPTIVIAPDDSSTAEASSDATSDVSSSDANADAKDATDTKCKRTPNFDPVCKNYMFNRNYAWSCPTSWPELPACSGPQCNCQGGVALDDAGASVVCCDVP